MPGLEFDEAETLDLVQALVRTPSHRGVEGRERAAAGLLAEHLIARGLEAHLVEVVDGRPNLVCTLDSGKSGPHLLLCGHTDTVPLNEPDPGVGFSGEIRDGRLLGRGAADMKGALASMASALVAVHRARALAAGRVTFAAVIDEEMESLGAEHLIASGFRADGAIVGEPTGNAICLGHKGLEWLEVTFRGRAAHGGTPGAGVNAIEAAAAFVSRVRAELVPRFAERASSLLGEPTLNFGTIQGGDQPSTVAAECVLTMDRRSVPGETYESICGELEEILSVVEARTPGLVTELRRLSGGMATLEHVALETDPGAAIVAASAAARRRVRGEAGAFGSFPAWTDGALLAEFAGIPTVILGPGDLARAHSPEESIPVAEVAEAARLYAQTALEFCSP